MLLYKNQSIKCKYVKICSAYVMIKISTVVKFYFYLSHIFHFNDFIKMPNDLQMLTINIDSQ